MECICRHLVSVSIQFKASLVIMSFFPSLIAGIVEQISGKIWHNRGFNDKSVKTSKIVHLDLLIKIGYGPIA